MMEELNCLMVTKELSPNTEEIIPGGGNTDCEWIIFNSDLKSENINGQCTPPLFEKYLFCRQHKIS